MNMEKIAKIDMHVHVTAFPELYPQPRQGGHRMESPEELLKIYDSLDIEMGVLQTLVSPEAVAYPITSEACKLIADKYPDRFAWFCGVDPRALRNTDNSNLSYLLQHYKALGAKGVGELTANLYADSPMIDNLFSHCEACDMPVTIHMISRFTNGYGLVDEPGLPRLEKMLQKHPALKLIGHSVPFWDEISNIGAGGRRLETLMRNYENLRCDLSANSGSSAMMRDPVYAAEFLTEFQDRVYYGTDFVTGFETHPFTFREFLDALCEEGKISQTVYRKVCRENAFLLLKAE